MGCRKLTYHQEPAIGASWKIFTSGKEKTVSTSNFCIDYYTYGMLMPGRNGSTGDYRYGFQGQEMDDEVKGEGNSVNYKFRMHDPRVGRFFAVDPLAKDYPWNSPYAFSENSVIAFVELEGLEKYFAPSGESLGQYGDNTEIRVVDEEEVDFAREQLSRYSRDPEGYDASRASGYLQLYLPRVGSASISEYAEDVADELDNATLETWAANDRNCFDAAKKTNEGFRY